MKNLTKPQFFGEKCHNSYLKLSFFRMISKPLLGFKTETSEVRDQDQNQKSLVTSVLRPPTQPFYSRKKCLIKKIVTKTNLVCLQSTSVKYGTCKNVPVENGDDWIVFPPTRAEKR